MRIFRVIGVQIIGACLDNSRLDDGCTRRRSRRARQVAMTMIVSVALCLSACQKPATPAPASSAPAPEAPKTTATPKPPARIELRGDDFPALLVEAEQAATPGQDHCQATRAKRIDELDGAWRSAVGNIQFSCSNDREQDAADTAIIARLQPDAATMFGLPVVEVRRKLSGAGSEDSYVLLGTMQTQGKAFLDALQAACGARQTQRCEQPAGGPEDGYYLQTSEIGGLRVGPDPEDPQRMIYAEVSGE